MWPKQLCFTGKQMGTFHWFQQERSAIPLCPCNGVYTDQLDRFYRLLVLQFSLRRPENSIYYVLMVSTLFLSLRTAQTRNICAHTLSSVSIFTKKYSKMIQKIY